ncbi:MAG: EAL domain-containing protein [Pseudomonadales bacterium]|nr:EAL domain-containing protein [Pseudomonadales bacterium]
MAKDTVTFGGSDHYPPFHFFDDQGDVTGFDIDIFKEAASQLAWNIEFRLDNWATIQQALLAGDVDVVPMFVSEERNQDYLFSYPINIEYHLLFGLTGTTSYNGIESLSGFRIAAENGAFATQEIARQNRQIIIVDASSEAAALDMVQAGEADLALLPSAIGWYGIQAAGHDNMAAISPPILPATYAFAVNPERPELVSDINSVIIQMQRNNTIATLRQQWLVPESETSIRDALQTAMWIVLPLVLIAILTIWSLLKSRGQLHKATLTAVHRGNLLRETREKAIRLYNHDSITGFPNRRKFTKHIRQKLAQTSKPQRSIAVAILGLHNLDTIRDAINDDAGEELVRQFAKVLNQSVSSYTAYLGDGQFAFVLEDINSRIDALSQVQSIIPAISQNLIVAGMTVHVRVSGGLATYPEDGTTDAQLIQQARLALSNAKKSGSQLLLFSDSMKPDPQKIQLMSDLEVVLAKNQLQWALQPQYWVNEKRVSSHEMLVRWHHPGYGWVSPGDFVVWAEQIGNVSAITDAAIKHVCTLMDQSSALSTKLCLSINLSANDLTNTALVERIVENAGDNINQLTVEITETALIQEIERVQRNVDYLKKAGVKLALDDYGTGYSSLEYLKAFNFNEIKIDRMFINDITSIERNLQLTRASIELGHNLGAKVVAEGVENQETADILIDMGCDILQGYHIGRPEIPASLADYLQTAGSFRMAQRT